MTRSISLAPDDRVELAGLGQLGQIAAERVERRRLALAALGLARGGSAAFGHASDSVPAPSRLSTSSRTSSSLRPGSSAPGPPPLVLAEQAEQQVLGADIVVIEVAGLFDGVFDHLLGPRAFAAGGPS
jgi:hypothetical protein